MDKYIKSYVYTYTYKYTLLCMSTYVLYYYIYICNQVAVATYKYTHECRYINKYTYIPNHIDMYNVYEFIYTYILCIYKKTQANILTYIYVILNRYMHIITYT